MPDSEDTHKQTNKVQVWFTVAMALVVIIVGYLLVIQNNDNAPNDDAMTHTVIATMADNNKSITIPKGDTLELKLSNRDWQVTDPTSTTILSETNRIMLDPNHTNPYGLLLVNYKARSIGFTSISGTATIRPICNEHMMCPEFIALEHYALNIDVIKN